MYYLSMLLCVVVGRFCMYWLFMLLCVFCFACLRPVPCIPVTLDCPFLIVPSVFSTVYAPFRYNVVVCFLAEESRVSGEDQPFVERH